MSRAYRTWTDFDAAGRPVRRGFPDGTYLPIEYDERGLLRAAGGVIEDARWTAWGTLDAITYGNGVVDERRYDARLRVERMLATDPGGAPLRDLTFDLDPASRITGVVDGRDGVDPMLDLSADFVFDDRYRLTDVTDRVATTTWTYDDVANIQTVTSGHDAPFLNVTNRYGEEGAGPDQLTHFGDERLRYDAAGRVIEDGSRELTYDAKGRLARVERGDVVEQYVYAYDDTRALKRTVTSDGTTSVRYIDHDVEDRDDHLVRYAFLGDERVVRLDPLAPGGRGAHTVGPLDPPPGSVWAMALLLLPLLLLRDRRRRLPAAAVASVALAISCTDDPADPRDDAQPIETWPAGAVLYLSDQAGSVVATADAAGAAMEATAFHPYGAPRADGTKEPWTYVGNESDTGSGLSDFRARPYRPEMGRFLAVDPVPIFSPLSPDDMPLRFQAYTYAGGDPANLEDASGDFVVSLGWTESETMPLLGPLVASGALSGGVALEIDDEWRVDVFDYENAAGAVGLGTPGAAGGVQLGVNLGTREDFETADRVVGGEAVIGVGVAFEMAWAEGRRPTLSLSGLVGAGAEIYGGISYSGSLSDLFPMRPDSPSEIDYRSRMERLGMSIAPETNTALRSQAQWEQYQERHPQQGPNASCPNGECEMSLPETPIMSTCQGQNMSC